jgi:anthranilate phosphoribosyltransferase
MIQDAISKVVQGHHLSEDEAFDVMDTIMTGGATQAQIASFITALRLKGETVDEIYACASVMREHASTISVPPGAVDTCGTGGDGLNTFNISTTAAFVVAGAGIPIAKHGNRSVSSRSGSADLLEALDVNVGLIPEQVAQCVEEVGIGFMFAPVFHSAMKHAIGPRREIGIRTVFNILGPLTNPANVERQVLGVYDPALTETMARVLDKFGVKHALIVNGQGMDELTTLGPTRISELRNGSVETYDIQPEDLGLSRAASQNIIGGDPEENAKITLGVLRGEPSPYLDITLLNAGAAIYVAGKADGIKEGIPLARESVISGKAKEKLDALIEISNKLGGGEQ